MEKINRIIWLASFPKSGNTWLRTFLANALLPPEIVPDINKLGTFTTGDVRKDFFDAAAGGSYEGQSIEDWLKMRPRALRLIASSKPSHHFVKTHCQARKMAGVDLIPPNVTAAAVYVIRNPFDLAPSFARHQALSVEDAIERMANPNSINGTANGIFEVLGRWDEHVDVWTNAPGLPKYVLRYEDMLANPGKTFGGLLEKFLRIKIEKRHLARAINATSFQAMKKQEDELGFSEKPKEMDKFFAKGRSGVWREDLDVHQVVRIREEFMPTLKKFYPELIKETEIFVKEASN